MWFEEFADDLLGGAVVTMFFNRAMARRFGREPDLAAADKAEAERLPRALDYLEAQIPASGFLVDDRLTLADIAVASFFANLGHIGVKPDPSERPKTAAYVSSILDRPAFQALLETERAFMAT